jgi:hypothetical protein
VFLVWQLDCGIHPGREGQDSLPYFDSVDGGAASIDILLITQYVPRPFCSRSIESSRH